MSFALEKVVPWGRSFEEYVSMFKLSEDDLKGNILGCSDGPASFNSSLTNQGGTVTSLDPIYGLSAEEIQKRIDETYDVVLEQVRNNKEDFVWGKIKTPRELGEIRMQAMSAFLSDFPAGIKAGRYVEGSLPALPFASQQFDLAVCSHFLFLYSEPLSEDFHVESILELCRVAREVRIFPIIEFGSNASRHLDSVISRLKQQNYESLIETVPYAFQKNGNQMLKIRRVEPAASASSAT
ncbi:MAG TPA: hypothetical protein VIR63_00440 [Pontiella sp.]